MIHPETRKTALTGLGVMVFGVGIVVTKRLEARLRGFDGDAPPAILLDPLLAFLAGGLFVALGATIIGLALWEARRPPQVDAREEPLDFGNSPRVGG